MLFRNHTGKIVEINRIDYITDKEYYLAIMATKNMVPIAKDESQQIFDYLKKNVQK